MVVLKSLKNKLKKLSPCCNTPLMIWITHFSLNEIAISTNTGLGLSLEFMYCSYFLESLLV